MTNNIPRTSPNPTNSHFNYIMSAILASACMTLYVVRSDNTTAQSPITPADPIAVSKAQKSTIPFDPKTYKPNTEYAVEVDRFFDPKNQKTIIYILDEHASGNGFDYIKNGVNPTGAIAQKGIFSLLKSDIERYGQIALLHEGWAEDSEKSTEENTRHNIAMNDLTTIYKKSDFSDRLKTASAMAGTTIYASTDLIAATYKDEVINIAPQSEKDRIDHLIPDITNNTIDTLSESNQHSCAKLGIKTTDSFATVMNDFTHGTTKKTENKECACTIATTTIAHMKNFEKSRRIDASTREINTAVHSPNSTIWVVTGMNHGKKAMELAKANKINIIVLAPKNMPKSFYQYQKLQSDAQVYQKDVEQVCGSISKYTNSALDAILAHETKINTEKLRQHYANIH